MALDRRNYKQLVDTTVELANKAIPPPPTPLGLNRSAERNLCVRVRACVHACACVRARARVCVRVCVCCNVCVCTTPHGLSAQVGGAEIIARVVDDLKDESEPYRKMVRL
jgi:hypothetical protein